MKVINVELTVKPGEQAAYEAFINKLVTGSRSEAGNLSYNHFKKNWAARPNTKSSSTGKMLTQCLSITKPRILRPFWMRRCLFDQGSGYHPNGL